MQRINGPLNQSLAMDNLVINEKEARHFFQWKKANKKVSIYYQDQLLASSSKTILLKKVGREIYDGVYYFPKEDVQMELFKESDTSTFCPIKGEAAYYSLGAEKDLAWYYPEPIKRSKIIEDRLAFYANKVKFIIEPLAEKE